MTWMKYYLPLLFPWGPGKTWDFKNRDPNVMEGEICKFWGYRFQWTRNHLKGYQLDRMRCEWDTLGDTCLECLLAKQMPGEDLYDILQREARIAEPGPVCDLWAQVNEVPVWVDYEQIARGQKVFYRYGGAALTVTNRWHGGSKDYRGAFKTENARRRLFETTQQILQVTRSLDDIKPGGQGHASTVRVRLLHSNVRRKITRLAKSYPDYYSLSDLGVPINDCDSIATICTFSASLIWMSFPSFGIFLREQEIEDYIALWRLVAFYIGAPQEPFENPHMAKAYMESIYVAELSPSRASCVLADNIIKALANQPPAYASYDFLVAQTRWLNGSDLSNCMNLPEASVYGRLLVLAQCLFFSVMCYFHRSIPLLDQRKIRILRRVFYKVIVEGKLGLEGETAFEMKYLPEYGMITAPGSFTKEMHVRHRGVERRNAKVLMMLAFSLVSSIYFGVYWWG